MGHSHLRADELAIAFTTLGLNASVDCPVVRLAQAQAWGVSRAQVMALVRRKQLVKVRHGVYCLARDWLASESDDALRRRLIAGAAIAGLRPPGWACGSFSAELHGLPLPHGQPSSMELVRQRGCDVRSARDRLKEENRLDGVVTLTRDLTGETMEVILGIPTISIDVATVTAAAQIQREFGVALVDAALRRGSCETSLLDACDRWSSSGGVSAVREYVSLGRAGAESPLESVSRIRLLDRGLPEPILQHEFHDARGFVARTDMWWPQWNLVGEADGLVKYETASDVKAEKIREDRLRAMGLKIVRWTWDDMWHRPHEVVARIRNAANS